jgi:small subunit ribosomal protein S33
MGNKILRQRLKGPALAAYYPRKMATIQDLQRAYADLPFEIYDEKEEDRFEKIKM